MKLYLYRYNTRYIPRYISANDLIVASCKQYLADWNVWSENKTQEYNQLLEAT